MEIERPCGCLKHPSFLDIPILLVCRAPVFLLWLLRAPPCGHHLHLLSGSTLSRLKGRAHSVAVPAALLCWPLLLCGPASPSLTLEGESLPSSVLSETTVCSCVSVACASSRVPASNMSLGSGLDAKMSAADFAPSHACCVRQGVWAVAHCV